MPLSRLNQEQLDAATAPSGQNLIIASAGTGKTSTIVGRIGHARLERVGKTSTSGKKQEGQQ